MPNALNDSGPGGAPPSPMDASDLQSQNQQPMVPQALTPPAQPQMQGGMPQGGALGQGQPGQSPNASPSHAWTVASLRHFTTLQHEIERLLELPDIGKTNVKSEIIEGYSRLVAERMMDPAMAVMQLGQVPDRPFEQKQWAQQRLAVIRAAEARILEDHAATNPGTLDWATEQTKHKAYSADSHMGSMNSVLSHYQDYHRARGIPNARS